MGEHQHTKVYHCQSDRWYGKTKEGQSMTEADAKAKNFRRTTGRPASSSVVAL